MLFFLHLMIVNVYEKKKTESKTKDFKLPTDCWTAYYFFNLELTDLCTSVSGLMFIVNAPTLNLH